MLRRLNHHHVPMDTGANPVICDLIRLSGREVERSRQSFRQTKYRASGYVDERIKPDSKFADISCTRISIEDVVEFFGVICRCLHYLTVLKSETDITKYRALIERRCIKMDNAIDRLADGSGKALSIGDIPFTSAGYDGNVLDAKFQICASVQ